MYKSVVLVSVTLTVFVIARKMFLPIVDTKYGPIRGYVARARNGVLYYSFKGIPYAKPPVGDLRFRPPSDPDPWEDVFIAEKHGPHCLQKNYLFSEPKIEGSEDCLYLNVYTSELKDNNTRSQKLLPVMVFIHWGGFFAGYSSSDYLGPEYIMDKDVVLVTFNYRLGVFGFLSSGGDASPGNYGLKDQVAVLKWVQENIEFFGGNKSEVTIFGQSAGGASVHYHILSPMSKGLFKRAISMSGTALALWAAPLPKDDVLQVFMAQARFVGCLTKGNSIFNTNEMVDCMRKVDAEDLLASADKFKAFLIDPLNIHFPVVEEKTWHNSEPFITRRPIDYIRRKEANFDVDWLIGLVDDEGLIRAEALIRQSKSRQLLNTNFDKVMPELLSLQLSLPEDAIPNAWEQIKRFYLIGDNGIDIEDNNIIEGLVNIYTDRAFGYSTYQAALFHSLQGHSKIRIYNFNYTGENSYGNIFAATNETINYKNWGVSHCDDLIYIFKSPALFPELKENDTRMSYFMVEILTNFAKYGDPLPTATKRWDPLDSIHEGVPTKKIKHLNINGDYTNFDENKIYTKRGIHTTRFKFWEDLPLYENIPELKQYTQCRP